MAGEGAAPQPAGFGAGRHAIEGIGRGGFLFGGASHIGSILALPSGVHAWRPAAVADIATSDLDVLFAERETIDFLLIGTGERFSPLPASVLADLKAAGLRFEMMSTSSAAQTYNILLAEDRRVAAALLAVR